MKPALILFTFSTWDLTWSQQILPYSIWQVSHFGHVSLVFSSLDLILHILSPFLTISFPCLFPPYLFIFFKLTFFWECFFTAELSERHRDFQCTPPHPTYTASPIITIRHQSGAFVTTDESTWTHHYHPKCTVYIRIHSWCCEIHEFGQTCDDMCPPLRYQTEHFHCPEHPLLSILLLLKRHFL